MTRRARLRRPRSLPAVGACAAAIAAGTLIGTTPAASASTPALPGGRAAAASPAVNYELVQIKSWDGACLSVPNGNLGTRLDQVSCSAAHNWWYDGDSGNLYLSGHANLQVGDSGGYLELKAAGTGTPIAPAAYKTGPGNVAYWEVWFNVAGTYWHANGSGQDVTFDSVAGDLANFWLLSQN